MVVGGFLAGRLGNAVDHEMRQQHHMRTTLPALLTAQTATNTALDAITKKLELLSEADLQTRADLTGLRRDQVRQMEQLSARIDHLDRRFDAMSDSQGVLYGSARRVYDPHLADCAAPPGRHPACQAGHWVPPLDRPGWGGQTEPAEEEPDAPA